MHLGGHFPLLLLVEDGFEVFSESCFPVIALSERKFPRVVPGDFHKHFLHTPVLLGNLLHGGLFPLFLLLLLELTSTFPHLSALSPRGVWRARRRSCFNWVLSTKPFPRLRFSVGELLDLVQGVSPYLQVALEHLADLSAGPKTSTGPRRWLLSGGNSSQDSQGHGDRLMVRCGYVTLL